MNKLIERDLRLPRDFRLSDTRYSCSRRAWEKFQNSDSISLEIDQ